MKNNQATRMKGRSGKLNVGREGEREKARTSQSEETKFKNLF